MSSAVLDMLEGPPSDLLVGVGERRIIAREPRAACRPGRSVDPREGDCHSDASARGTCPDILSPSAIIGACYEYILSHLL
eukprot:2312630-Pyramimonas_sp.AAC.2